MADHLGMDPGRIERLRSPERLTYLNPERVWEVVAPVEAGVIVDIGTGFMALPLARRFPRSIVYACDILDWKDEENPVRPPGRRSVPEPILARQIKDAGFVDIESHDIYTYHYFLTGLAGYS